MSLMTARPSSEGLSIEDPNFLNIETCPDWERIFNNQKPLKLEIGFGMGDFLIEMAIRENQSNFIGMDFTKNGTLNLLSRIKTLHLSNIRVIYGDAKKKLSTLVQDEKLESIYINFPDPWPKKRHIKLRLINPSFANLVIQKLAVKGRVYLSTDSEQYAQEILQYFNAEPLCQNMYSSGFLESRNSLPKTKYEKSFLYAGEKTYYLEYSRLGITDSSKKQRSKTIPIEKKISQGQSILEPSKDNDTLLTEKLQKEETKAKDACDLKKVADSIAKAGNKEWAKRVYKKVEEEAQDSLDFNWLGQSVFEVFGDTDWTKRIYKKAENQAETSLDFNWLAYSISETIGDNNWVKRLYEEAAHEPCNIRELCDLADSVFETLGDLNWVKNIYRTAEEKTNGYSDFSELADNLHKNLGDKQKARELYKKAEGKAKVMSDFCSLSESIYKKFKDKEWATNLYFKAASNAKDSHDFCCLADSLCENLRDQEWAKEIYKKAEIKAEYSHEARWLAESIYENLGDKEWAKKLYNKAGNKATLFFEISWLAKSIYENLGDKEWAKKLYNKAEGKAKHSSDLDYLKKHTFKVSDEGK
jgi:tRNA (guanine-N7-)-methyltransferase